MPTPFDAQFWQDEEAYLWEAISALYFTSLMAGMDGGVQALPSDLQPLVDYDVLNTNALDFAKQYRYEWIKKINDTTRTQVQEAMADWIRSGDPLSVLETTLTPIFGKVRAEMIAATEITRIFAEANTAAWGSTGFISTVQWNTSRDDRVCPICSPRAGQKYAMNDTGNRPPAHIRCRCFVTPVVDVEAVAAQVERILNG